MRLVSIIAAVVLIAGLIGPINGAKILALFALPAKSHSNMLNAVLRGLLAKGHELTVVHNFPLPANTPNYTYVDISPPFDIWSTVKKYYGLNTTFELHTKPPETYGTMLSVMSYPSTELALKHPNVQKLLHNASLHFDLVLVEQFQQEAMLMFAHQFKAPLVSICSYEVAQSFDEMFGVFGAWSHVPHERLLLNDRMTFWERVQSVKFSLQEWYFFHWIYMPEHQRLADKYFAHLPEPRPTIEQLNRNISVLLMNGHAPLKYVRPTVPGLVDVGGVHIGAVKLLPADIQSFLDGAGPEGVIFFSLGTQLRCADMPSAQLETFISTFRRMSNVRILWKWEDEELQERLPANVLVKKWLPQSDCLAHPRVRVFITHGGLLGHSEGVHHAVPMLGIPFFADQHMNMARAEAAGYAISLTFSNVTDVSLRWAFDELFNNPRYGDEIRRVSKIFRDRPESALDRAVYWIEYVIRHKGAYHLRSTALDLNWFTYMLLDVVTAGLALVVITAVFLWMATRKVIQFVRIRHKSLCTGTKNKVN